MTALRKPLAWGLLLVFCLLWFYALGARTLVPTDEGRYAEMAREMVTTNDWVTPRLNGTKYFYKPPLQYWMNALTFKAFGLGEWQARLWTGLCGLLGIGLAWWTGRKLYGERVGVMAAVVLASSFYWAALAHVNTLDMGLSGMMALALCGLLLAQRDGAGAAERRNWMIACWAGMALATMSKGLIGVVLPGAVLVIYTFAARDWGIWKRLHFSWGVPVFFLITAPWFILVSIANPEFPHFFFIHEHFDRFTSKVHNRAGPLYYFIPILLLGILPWLGALSQGVWRGLRHAEAAVFQPGRMLAVWAIFIFVFFSVSSSKLPSYILPIFPALALLIACYLEQSSHKAVSASAWLLAAFAGIGLFFVPRISEFGTEAYELPLYQSYEKWVAAAAILALAGSIAAAVLARRQKDAAILALAVTGFVGGQLLMLGHEPLGRYASGVDHVPAIKAELAADTPIYIVGRYEQALPFYLGRTLTMVQHADEMKFGLQQEPHLWLPTREEFIGKWTAQRIAGIKAVAILNHDAWEQFKSRGLPMQVIGKDPRRVVVTNGVVSAPVSRTPIPSTSKARP
jgi:4-amino-4-deoxy-L-arabinose transferase-like glycosyltransferase